jgi:hypothetical protein
MRRRLCRRPEVALVRRPPQRRSGLICSVQWPLLLAIAVGLSTCPIHTAGCWEQIHNPFIEADAALEAYLCGACSWECVGDDCGAAECDGGDYNGDGQADCRCDICGEEILDKVFNGVTCRCVTQIIDADGNIITSGGVELPVCEGIEVGTNYVGGDCNCYDDDPLVSYDGTHLRIADTDSCVYACRDYSMPYYAFREQGQQCWCKSEEGYNVRLVACTFPTCHCERG